MKICQSCGCECSDKAAFCERCGARFSDGESPSANGTAPEKGDPVFEQPAREPALSEDGVTPLPVDPDDLAAEEEENAYREMRRQKILNAIKSPVFLVLCIAELIMLLAGILINLTSRPGNSVSIPLLTICFCLCFWMIYVSVKKNDVIPEGWIKFLRVIMIILKVAAWIVFGAVVSAGIVILLVPSEVYEEAMNEIGAEFGSFGADVLDEIKTFFSEFNISLKTILSLACFITGAFSAVFALFFGKMQKFFECVMREARGDFSGMYPSGVVGFCWFYVIASAFGTCLYLIAPPYNVFAAISYCADVVCAVAIALTVNKAVSE